MYNLKTYSDDFFMKLSNYLINENMNCIDKDDLNKFFRGKLKNKNKRKTIESKIMFWINDNTEPKE